MFRSNGLAEMLVFVFIAYLLVKTFGSRLLGSIMLGSFLGAMVGFMHRPSVPAMGQLPFDTVVTRGEAVRFDESVRPNAELSFNYLIGGGVLGAFIFGFAGMAMVRSPAAAHLSGWGHTDPVQKMIPPSEPSSANPQTTGSRFCTNCGAPLGHQWTFCGSCGTRRT